MLDLGVARGSELNGSADCDGAKGVDRVFDLDVARGSACVVKSAGGVFKACGLLVVEREGDVCPVKMLVLRRFQMSWAFRAEASKVVSSEAMRAAMARSSGSTRKS